MESLPVEVRPLAIVAARFTVTLWKVSADERAVPRCCGSGVLVKAGAKYGDPVSAPLRSRI